MPDFGVNDLDEVLQHPRETLHIELKDWFDPRNSEGIAKLVKACFAIYNRDGGMLFIGFDNTTGKPSPCNIDPKALEGFHADVIQAALSKYASRPFSVDVLSHSVAGHHYPIIKVPSGVWLPVVVRCDLINKNGRKLLQVGQLYFRTLNSNLTASSSVIKWNDYDDLMDVLFQNRETDIGAFLRRNMNIDTIGTLLEALGAARKAREPAEQPFKKEQSLLDEGRTRYLRALVKRNVEPAKHGSLEIAAVIDTQSGRMTTSVENLWRVLGANPNYTGWPWWVSSLGFHNWDDRPYVMDNSWKRFIYEDGTGWGAHLDFWIIDLPNRFYHRRALQDDIGGSSNKRESMKLFDPVLATLRVAEALAVPLHFARTLGLAEKGQAIGYGFRWTGLSGRELSTWANPERHISPGRRSVQDEVTIFVNVPASANEGALTPIVKNVMDDVTSIFSGFTIPQQVVENMVKRLFDRRL